MQSQSEAIVLIDIEGELHLVPVVKQFDRSDSVAHLDIVQFPQMTQAVGDLLCLELQLLRIDQVLPCASTALVKVLTNGRDSVRRRGDNLPHNALIVSRFFANDLSHDCLTRKSALKEDYLSIHVCDSFAVKGKVSDFQFYQFVAQCVSFELF